MTVARYELSDDIRKLVCECPIANHMFWATEKNGGTYAHFLENLAVEYHLALHRAMQAEIDVLRELSQP